MSSTLTSFTAGDLVISIVGDGDDSGTYTDNQASPITLEEITPIGDVVGTMVLPQTTTVVDGVTEDAISGEYGSSSEGHLQLAEDGESLVIGGYGINAATYNAGGAAVYGDARLAQSTSLTGTGYTAVPRVIADIRYNGTVDTSTTLYNVFNTNNIRSVATVDGTSFYIAGQGVKGDTTQGVFYAADGASVATAIDTSTDARVAEIVNGVLYVSRDSKQGPGGTSNIGSYGTTLPVSATRATVLPDIDGSVTLTAAEENTVNSSLVGSTVSLSPEAYFFASTTVVYVADSGNPKGGGLGDGGLQKWSYNGTGWVLDYTLSLGLNLVADTSASGTTGLVGLTGEVEGDKVVLYATNATVGDLDQTYLFTVTDDLSATAPAPNERFTTLVTAAADTNIRGISFAPTDMSTASAVIVSSGGSNTSATISDGGSIVVKSGGVAINTVILSGATATVAAGGSASGGVLAHGATEIVLGSVSGTQIDGTQIVSAAGASVVNETVYNGGVLELAIKGATASGITLNNGGVLSIDGNAKATNTTILSGGTIKLESAKATLAGAIVFSGQGTLEIDSVSSTGYGAQATISGFSTGDIIDDTVMGSSATLSTTVSGGNTVVTLSSGSVSQQFVFAGSALASSLALSPDSSGGVEMTVGSKGGSSSTSSVVSSGASLSGAVISGGDVLSVNVGGKVVGATVLSGGTLNVSGEDSGSVISAGGTENISGSATGDTVYGQQSLAVSGASIANETVMSGGSIDITIKGITATGTTLNGGSLSIDGNSAAINTVLTNGAELDLLSPKASVTGTLVFSGGGTLIQSVAPSSSTYGIQAVISGFSSDDIIDLDGISSVATLTSTTSDGDTLVTVTDGTTSETLTFAGDYAADFFVLGADSAGGLSITAEGTPCYCPGTAILTETGERPVETLQIGDRLLTRNGSLRPIRWIGRRAYDGYFAAGRTDIMPVRIRAGALGEGLPRRDLIISPLHAMFLDNVLVPAHALVNGHTITQAERASIIDYIHIELETHDIIFAEGAMSETFIDDSSRGMFHNAHEYAALYPDAEPVAARYCAPRVEEGEVLEVIRRRLMPLSGREESSFDVELYVDVATRGWVAGWARDVRRPHKRMRLRVRTGDLVLCEVTADRYRADLEASGKGDGCHAFEVDLIGGLSEQQLAALVVEPVTNTLGDCMAA